MARKELGITETYSDYDEMLNLAASSSAHAEQSIKALERGWHVFFEKPMGVSVEECRRVEAAADAHSR